MTRRSRIILLVVCGVAVVLGSLAVVTSGSDPAEAERQPLDAGARGSFGRDPTKPPGPGEPPGVPIRSTFPAKMLEPGFQGFYSTALLWPMRNGWQVSNHRTFTAVYAGGDGTSGQSDATGRFLIYRQNYLRLTEETSIVDVPDAGHLRIVSAPLGEHAGAWAQEQGTLEFEGQSGVRGTLDLSDDSIALVERH
jgi:hypothetical protein